MESPWALTEHALEGAGHFFFHTHAGMTLLNLGLLAGVIYLGYHGIKAIGSRMFDTRAKVKKVLS